MYDVVLVYLNIVNGFFSGAEYQLDCGYIGSYLLKNSIRVCQYINKKPSSMKNVIIDLQENYSCNNYCFYINEYNYYISKTVINEIKTINMKCNIIIVGPSAEYIGTNLMNEINADCCIDYAAAITLKRMLVDKRKQTISNIIYREDTEIHRTDKDYFPYSLDDLGFPYQSGMIPPEEIQNVGMITSTGCYGNCTFCSYKKESKSFKIHLLGSVLEEIDYISHYIKGANIRMNFLDDCFSVDSERTYELCKNLRRQEFKFRYWCCSRADLLNEDIIDLMAECNFNDIVIGLETASERVFDKLGKIEVGKDSSKYISRIAKLYKYGRKKGINPYVSANFGLPFEDFDGTQKTMEYLSENRMKENVSICFTTAFPGSKLFDENYLFDLQIEESPYRLPFRTLYKDYMRTIYYQLKDIGYQILKQQEWQRIIIEAFSGLNIKGKNTDLDCVDYIFTEGINEESFDIINRYLSVNGYIFIEIDKLLFKKIIYSEDRKTLCMILKQYDYIMHKAYSENYYIPNILFYHIVDNNIYFQPNSIYIPEKNSLKIRIIKSKDDYEELNKEAQEFCVTRIVLRRNLKKGFVLDSCRWVQGTCNRIVCQNNGKRISKCCHDEKDLIGYTEESQQELFLKYDRKKYSCKKAHLAEPHLIEYLKVLSFFYSYYDISQIDEHIGAKVDENMNFTII